MFGINWLQKITKALIASLITVILAFSLVGCGDRVVDSQSALRAATPTGDRSVNTSQRAGSISEVSPPEVIQELRQALEVYQPQVAILSPQSDQVLQENTVTARFQIQDLPLFQNAVFDLGPHLHVILDNQPYIAVYDISKPLEFPDLSPGTHTLRVFASRPWHESFKNEGAYAQTTFHVYTKTEDNNPDVTQPLLTYSRPKGSYGAEPILLDFYLTNAPLHLVAQKDSKDNIADWRIRCTINGNSFVLDRWQPVYLKGFKPGENWVQLEFLDDKGNSVKNVFNNTARLITYEPKGKDTLSKLVRGELTVAEARGIVDQNYTLPTPASTPSATPALEAPLEAKPDEDQEVKSEAENQESVPTSETESKQQVPQKHGGFFNRRRSSTATPAPSSTPIQTEETKTSTPELPVPDVVTPQELNTAEPQPLAKPEEEVTPEEESIPSDEQKLSKQTEKQKYGGFFNRFRRPTTTPKLPPTLPEIIDSPAPELVPPQVVPQVENSGVQ